MCGIFSLLNYESESKYTSNFIETQFKKESHNFDHLVNRYTKFDPTLPHIHLRCPNDSCNTNKEKNVTDAIYIRYDNTQLKYLYICTECDHKWKNE